MPMSRFGSSPEKLMSISSIISGVAKVVNKNAQPSKHNERGTNVAVESRANP